MVRLARRYKHLPKHRRPYPYNKPMWWQLKDRVRHRLFMLRYDWRDVMLEVKEIYNALKDKK